jgi:hypothetical protein
LDSKPEKTAEKKPSPKQNLYRVNILLQIRSTGLMIPPGVIADLSGITSKTFIEQGLANGWIEKVDSAGDEPVFGPDSTVPEVPCPCR